MLNQIQTGNSVGRYGDTHKPERVAAQPTVGVVHEDARNNEQQKGSTSSNNFGNKSPLEITSQAHYQAAQAQTAQHVLKEAKRNLEQLRQVTRRSLSANETKRTQLQQQLNQLKSKLQKLASTQFDYKAVLNADLSPRQTTRNERVSFSLKGVRLNKVSHSPEVLRFQVNTTPVKKVKVEAYDAADDIARKLTTALSETGIKVKVDKFNELAFSAPKSQWSDIESTIWMSGEGHLLPAGSMIKARPEIHGEPIPTPQKLNFSDTKSTRVAMAHIEQMLKNVEAALADLAQLQLKVSQELQQISTVPTNKATVEAEVKWARQPEDVSLRLKKNAVPVLLAQANASRHQVVALLEV